MLGPPLSSFSFQPRFLLPSPWWVELPRGRDTSPEGTVGADHPSEQRSTTAAGTAAGSWCWQSHSQPLLCWPELRWRGACTHTATLSRYERRGEQKLLPREMSVAQGTVLLNFSAHSGGDRTCFHMVSWVTTQDSGSGLPPHSKFATLRLSTEAKYLNSQMFNP